MNKPTGRQLRDRGIADTLAGDTAAHRDHASSVWEALDALIGCGGVFTADDLRAKLPDDVRALVAPSVIGAVFQSAAKRNMIACVGYTASTNPSRRAGIVRRWVAVATTMGAAA